MPIGFEINLSDWFEKDRVDKKHMEEWAKNRIAKKCKCGNFYSYEKGGIDPKECQGCRGEEGELVF